MRGRRRDHASLRGRASQLNLFVSAPVSNDPLLWVTFPKETRQAVTSLLARIVLEHGCQDRGLARTGAADDV